MISFKDVIKGVSISDIPIAHQQNIDELLRRMGMAFSDCPLALSVTSGYRSMQDHLRIYRSKGITEERKIPMQSRHLIGQAVDLADSSGALKKWVKENEKLMEAAGLYFEDFAHTPTWVHVQSVPPKSGKRFFIP